MTTFFFFGGYSRESISGIDARRTRKAEEIITGFGGRMSRVYALLGSPDLVMIAELPGVPEAMQASIAITRATGISFSTSAAMPVAEFDQLAHDAAAANG